MQREDRHVSRAGRRALAFGGALALAIAGSGTAFAASSNPVAAKEWALDVLQNGQIHSKYNARGTGIIVAVVDTGVDPTQPDLQGRLVDGVNLTDPSSPSSDFSDSDGKSHGTSIATIIAANPHKDSSGNQDGMLGLADEAKIMPIKAGTDGGTSSASLAAGILYAVHHGAQVINISQATTTSDASVTGAVNTALAGGVVVVVGAGNTGESGNAANAIATIPGVIDVAGIDQNSQIYHPGHYGTDVDVAAPANEIEVGLIGGQYGQYSGTSLATPWVAGEAALLIAEHPTWTSGQVVAAIVDDTAQTAAGQTTAGHRLDNYVGYGVIDPLAALGASEPSNTANPLGGPAITSNPAENLRNASAGASTGATAPGTSTATGGTSPTASKGSSSKTPLIIGVVVVVVLLVALLIFLLSRRNKGGGNGGPGGGGGGGSAGYHTPQAPPGGQYGNPPHQQNPYQQQPPQGTYPPQGGGYGQQQNPYTGN
ncbi:MAG TPA: S8 family serine peptidase [Actinospica sp.]|jgi:subtilisin family serine protease|nr:S8 family serine peptidase [Actinospica sp.]